MKEGEIQENISRYAAPQGATSSVYLKVVGGGVAQDVFGQAEGCYNLDQKTGHWVHDCKQKYRISFFVRYEGSSSRIPTFLW